MKEVTSSDAAAVGVRDLKAGLSRHLARVKQGEEIMVTEHGRPIARLIPVGADTERMTALLDAGIVRPPKKMTRQLPAKRVRLADGGSIDGEIEDQRR